MRRPGAVASALALAAVALAMLVAAQLTHGATRLAGSNDVAPQGFVVATERAGTEVCQLGERLWEGTSRLRMTIGTYGKPGPRLAVTVRDDSDRVLARGTLASGWHEGVVELPVRRRLPQAAEEASVCVRQRERARLVYAGEPADPSGGATVDGEPLGARLSIAYLLPGRPSLLDVGGRVVERYDAGNARWLGGWTWVAMIACVLGALAAAGLALWRHESAPSRLCALVALLFSLTWALLTPPFHVPDEISHVSYVQIVTETGKLPHEDYSKPVYSPQQNALLDALQFSSIIGKADEKPPWSAAESAAVRDAEFADLSRRGTNAATASGNPPLYYLLEVPVYAATRWASLLEQQLPMRLLSVLLAPLTVLAVFAFLRELLPRSPWTWTGGALAVAMQPLFGFVSGGVNPDSLLFACSALTLLAMARLLRRGLSVRRMALLAAAVAAGALTKPLFLALVPAAATAGLVALARARRAGASWLTIGRASAVGIAFAAVPVALYQLVGAAAFDHGLLAAGTSVTAPAGAAGPGGTASGVRHELSYIWQLFLPRLPTMNELFPPPASLPLKSIWMHGLIGRFGWLDYAFAPWVLNVGSAVLAAVAALAAAALVVHPGAMRGRWLELACYALAALGLVAIIGTQQWRAVTLGSSSFTQARYLLPLLALYGGLIAVALRLFSRRAGPVAAVVVAAVAALHSISALLLTVVRYYA